VIRDLQPARAARRDPSGVDADLRAEAVDAEPAYQQVGPAGVADLEDALDDLVGLDLAEVADLPIDLDRGQRRPDDHLRTQHQQEVEYDQHQAAGH